MAVKTKTYEKLFRYKKNLSQTIKYTKFSTKARDASIWVSFLGKSLEVKHDVFRENY